MPVKGNESLQRKLVAERSSPEYFKVTMTLSDILEGAFFTEYIKRGSYFKLRFRLKKVLTRFQGIFSCARKGIQLPAVCLLCRKVIRQCRITRGAS